MRRLVPELLLAAALIALPAAARAVQSAERPATGHATGETPPIEASRGPMPARGRIVFLVYRGEYGLQIGRNSNQWEIRDGGYRLSSRTETTGVLAMIKHYTVETESRGRVGTAGLRPDYFSNRRNGEESNETASFDWSQMRLKLGTKPDSLPLEAGSQDVLSFNYQFGFLRQLPARGEMWVATGKKYERYVYEIVGDEALATPAGSFHTVHIKVPGERTTELWLATEHHLLPVKMRFIDKNGDVYDQLASEFQVWDR